MKGKTVWLVQCWYDWELCDVRAFATKISALKWISRRYRKSGRHSLRCNRESYGLLVESTVDAACYRVSRTLVE
jgi:hypothetical protein